jgi:hypothetical protein
MGTQQAAFKSVKGQIMTAHSTLHGSGATPRDYEDYFAIPSAGVLPRQFFAWARLVVGSIEKDLPNSSLPQTEREVLEGGLAKALDCLLQEGQHERF